MDGWVGHVGWPIDDVWPTKWSSVQLAVWRRIGKARRPMVLVTENPCCWLDDVKPIRLHIISADTKCQNSRPMCECCWRHQPVDDWAHKSSRRCAMYIQAGNLLTFEKHNVTAVAKSCNTTHAQAVTHVDPGISADVGIVWFSWESTRVTLFYMARRPVRSESYNECRTMQFGSKSQDDLEPSHCWTPRHVSNSSN